MARPSLLPRNEHSADRLLRVALGVGGLSLALTGISAWGWVGLVPLVTGLVGTCPLYRAFGVSTCKIR